MALTKRSKYDRLVDKAGLHRRKRGHYSAAKTSKGAPVTTAKNLSTLVLTVAFSCLGYAQTATETLPAGGNQAALSASSQSTSSESQSTTPLKEVLSNKKFQETNEVTDAKLKAEAGSLSRYSMKGNLSYYGPTIGDLSAKDQPNPDGSRGTYETALSGTVGIRYRLDSTSSVSGGTGLKVIHPLHGAERTDVQTPFLSYDVTSRTAAGIQMRNSFGLSYVTIPTYVEVGEVASASYDISSVYNLGDSRFAVGLDGNVSYFIYNRSYQKSDRGASRGSVAIYPTLKYSINDQWGFATSTSINWLAPRDRSNETVLLPRTVTQRVGISYGYSRTIYVYPYLTVFPTRMAWDTTTMNISTTFSIL